MQDRCESAGGRGLGGRAEVQPHVLPVGRIDRQEQRRLTFGDRLHRRFLELGRDRREFPAELEQQLQLVLALDGGEIVDDLGEGSGQGHRAGTSPGSSPLTIGTRTALPHSVHDPS